MTKSVVFYILEKNHEGNKMKISKGLIAIVVCSVVSLAGLSFFSVKKLESSNEKIEYVNMNIIPSINELNKAKNSFDSLRIYMY